MSILDPALHTVSMVRARSAFLFTVILAVGATAIATHPEGTEVDVQHAINLQAHAEKLIVVILVNGLKSCEIVQAQLLFHSWQFAPRRFMDDVRWMRLSMCSRMAMELGLHRKRRFGGDPDDSSTQTRLRVNDIRTRAFLLMTENW